MPVQDNIIDAIAAKIGIPDIAERLTSNISHSELNSLLLGVFSRSLTNRSPAELLRQYRGNRFVQPAGTDMIGLLKLELSTLEFLRDRHFQPIELSPAAQLGSCSIVAPADQKKIISATRHTEIMADATNSIALHIAAGRKSPAGSPPLGSTPATLQRPASQPMASQQPLQERFCTVHRHIRTPAITVKSHTPHFKVGCLVTSGRDVGSHQFECVAIEEQFKALATLFESVYGIKPLLFKLQPREGYEDAALLLDRMSAHLERSMPGTEIVLDKTTPKNTYYKGIQFKMIIRAGEKELQIADGGFVDWTQQLLGNRKERLLISGFGLDLVYKMLNGQL